MPTMTKAEREKQAAIRTLEQHAEDYLEFRAKRDEYEAQMNNLSAQMQVLMLAHGIPKHESPNLKLSMVQGTSRTLQATQLLAAGCPPDVLDKGYVVRPTQYVTVKRKDGQE